MIEKTKKMAVHNVAVRVQDDLFKATKRTMADTNDKFQTLIPKLLADYVKSCTSRDATGCITVSARLPAELEMELRQVGELLHQSHEQAITHAVEDYVLRHSISTSTEDTPVCAEVDTRIITQATQEFPRLQNYDQGLYDQLSRSLAKKPDEVRQAVIAILDMLEAMADVEPAGVGNFGTSRGDEGMQAESKTDDSGTGGNKPEQGQSSLDRGHATAVRRQRRVGK